MFFYYRVAMSFFYSGFVDYFMNFLNTIFRVIFQSKLEFNSKRIKFKHLNLL